MPEEIVDTASAYGLNFLIPIRDTGVGQCRRQSGEFARVEIEFILAACDGDLLDVGANIGAICLPFAAQRPASRVVAVEAHRKLAQILGANALNNRLHNVEVIHAVAGERTGTIEIPFGAIDRPVNIGASSIYEKGLPAERVMMRPMDEIASANVRFVKVEVEGFEPRVLDGSARLLRDIRPRWLVEVSRERPNTADLIRKTFKQAGYRIFWFFSPFVAPKPGASGDARGDFAYFATDETPPWPMKEVGDDWPRGEADLPYLRRYTGS